jgi:hypothetical protein
MNQHKSSTLLHHIKDLPMALFIDVATTDNFALLGTGTAEQLQDAWDNIMQEYDSAIGSKDAHYRLEQVKELFILQSKIARGNAIITILKNSPSIEIYNELFQFEYDIPEMEYCEKSIQRMVVLFKAHQKLDISNYTLIINEFESQNKDNESQKITRDSFINMIGAFTTHYKMAFNIKTESVEMYCTYVRMYINEIEKIIESQKKIK